MDVQVSRDTFAAHSEPALAENPTNHRNLIAGSKFFTDPAHYRFKIGTFYSMDGGRTWHDSGLLPGFNGYEITSDISLAFAADGTAYACVLAVIGKTSGIFVLRSTNGGKTFGTPVPVFLDTSGDTFSDKPWITVDNTRGKYNGTVYVAWNLDSNRAANGADPGDALVPAFDSSTTGSAAPVGMVMSHSTDGGKIFSAPVRFSTFDHSFGIGAIPAVGPQGQLYVVYASIDNQKQNVTYLDMVTSLDGGNTFTDPAVIQDVHGIPNHLGTSTFRNLSLPAFAVSPSDGTLLVAWADEGNSDADILSSRSTDGGKTWSAPYRVNHDRLNNGKDQFMPALAVSPSGVFTCAWFDRRHDPRNRLIDEEIAQSHDNGATFGHNFRVTARSWDPDVDAPRPDKNDTFIGDYQAVTADDRAVHPLWNDTQNGKTQEIRTVVMPVVYFYRR